MATWDDSPMNVDSAAWQPDPSNDFDAGNGGFTGDFDAANVSKHDQSGGTNDGGCRICGEEGHFARECPDKKPNTGECYNCGEVGHNKADCPNPRAERAFTGTCRICQKEGHRAADCDEKPAQICKICKEEGHIARECTVNRIHVELTSLKIEGDDPEEAWAIVVVADKEKDLDEIKQALLAYSKLQPQVTLPEIEQRLRDAAMNTFLIAKQQEINDTHTIINLQGESGQKYVLSFQFSATPRRAKFAEGWPQSKEENLARLAEAGFVMDAMVAKCSNCGEIGHISKSCEQEKRKIEIIVTCANCDATGHRARDCTEPRKSYNKKSCRICEGDDHLAKDCSQRVAQTCYNCNEEGHRAAECPNERTGGANEKVDAGWGEQGSNAGGSDKGWGSNNHPVAAGAGVTPSVSGAA